MALATSWNTTRFVVKHTVAAAVVTAGTGLFAGVSWLAAYLWASMSHSGSEPAFPFLWAVLGGLASGAASSVLVLLPSTALAEVVATRARLARLVAAASCRPRHSRNRDRDGHLQHDRESRGAEQLR